MVQDKLVSIIIPAYNVEKYISRGLESCLNQTYTKIEIVVINDGSTDKTGEVVEDFQKKDSRIVFREQNNAGVSAARNHALSVAKGEYLLFLDSDDWLEESAVQTLISAAERNQNYLICSDCFFVYFNPEGGFIKEQQDLEQTPIKMHREQALLKMGHRNVFKLQSSCYKLFQKKIIDMKNLRFDECIHNGEDGLFTFQYLKCVEGLEYLPQPLWYILERPGSATTSPYNVKWLTAIDAIQKMLAYDDNSIQVQRNLCFFLTDRTIGIAIECIRAGMASKKEMQLFRGILRKHMFKLQYQNMTMKRWVQYILLAYSPKKFLEWIL